MCLEQPRGHSEAAEGYYHCPRDSPRAVWWNRAKRKLLLKPKKRKTCMTLFTQWCLVGAASSCGDVSLQPGRFCEGTWNINALKRKNKKTGILEESQPRPPTERAIWKICFPARWWPSNTITTLHGERLQKVGKSDCQYIVFLAILNFYS